MVVGVLCCCFLWSWARRTKVVGGGFLCFFLWSWARRTEVGGCLLGLERFWVLRCCRGRPSLLRTVVLGAVASCWLRRCVEERVACWSCLKQWASSRCSKQWASSRYWGFVMSCRGRLLSARTVASCVEDKMVLLLKLGYVRAVEYHGYRRRVSETRAVRNSCGEIRVGCFG